MKKLSRKLPDWKKKVYTPRTLIMYNKIYKAFRSEQPIKVVYDNNNNSRNI